MFLRQLDLCRLAASHDLETETEVWDSILQGKYQPTKITAGNKRWIVSTSYASAPRSRAGVGRDLGVRYVLQGSIRRAGDRVRISVQLADAVTGIHRWAERYDRQLEDVFAVQDEMARTIAAILAAHANKAEIERTLNRPPADLQAYDYYLRAADAYGAFWPSYQVADLHEVRRLLEKSLAIDPAPGPSLAAPISPGGSTSTIAIIETQPPLTGRMSWFARRSNSPPICEAYGIFAQVLTRRGEHDAAIAAFERAVALNPNFMDWRVAEVLVLAGDQQRAIATIKRYMRLDPFYVPVAPGWLGVAHYMLKQYSQALAPSRECAARAPYVRLGHLCLAAAYAQLGKSGEAHAEAAELLRIDPKCTINKIARLLPFRRPEDAEHYFNGLCKAGLQRPVQGGATGKIDLRSRAPRVQRRKVPYPSARVEARISATGQLRPSRPRPAHVSSPSESGRNRCNAKHFRVVPILTIPDSPPSDAAQNVRASARLDSGRVHGHTLVPTPNLREVGMRMLAALLTAVVSLLPFAADLRTPRLRWRPPRRLSGRLTSSRSRSRGAASYSRSGRATRRANHGRSSTCGSSTAS